VKSVRLAEDTLGKLGSKIVKVFQLMLDAILVVIFITIAVVGVYRGCGKIVFDFFALLGTLWVDSNYYVQAAHSLRIMGNDNQNDAAIFALLFVLIGAIGLVISHIAYESILLSLGILDKTFGFFLGAATAIIVCHAIVKTINIATYNNPQSTVLASSRVADEMLNFTTYHATVDDMYNATGGHRVVEVYH
jgi:uncharacterized membrane protein required for colicin V production